MASTGSGRDFRERDLGLQKELLEEMKEGDWVEVRYEIEGERKGEVEGGNRIERGSGELMQVSKPNKKGGKGK